MCAQMLPVGHEVLAAEDEEEVEAAGPQTHRHPVLLHPQPVLGRLELLDTTSAVNNQEEGERRASLVTVRGGHLLEVEHVGVVPPLGRGHDGVGERDHGQDGGHAGAGAGAGAGLQAGA